MKKGMKKNFFTNCTDIQRGNNEIAEYFKRKIKQDNLQILIAVEAITQI
jgi:hypothetical protein